jgi:hypothetical protein
VPYIRVVFEEVLEALGQALLAAGVELGGADGGDQRDHRRIGPKNVINHFCADREDIELESR